MTVGGQSWSTAAELAIGGGPSDPSPRAAYAPGSESPYFQAWWKFTASADGWVAVDTHQTTPDGSIDAWPDTVLAVYVGDESSPRLIGFSDDDYDDLYGTSEARFPVTAGTTYHVKVGTYGSDGSQVGNYVVNVSGIPAPQPGPHADGLPQVRAHLLTWAVPVPDGSGGMTATISMPPGEADDLVVLMTAGDSRIERAYTLPGNASWFSRLDSSSASTDGLKTRIFTQIRYATGADEVQLSFSPSATEPVMVGLLLVKNTWNNYEPFSTSYELGGAGASTEPWSNEPAIQVGDEDLYCHFIVTKGEAGAPVVGLGAEIESLQADDLTARWYVGKMPQHGSPDAYTWMPGTQGYVSFSFLAWGYKYGPWEQGPDFEVTKTMAGYNNRAAKTSKTIVSGRQYSESREDGIYPEVTPEKIQDLIDNTIVGQQYGMGNMEIGWDRYADIYSGHRTRSFWSRRSVTASLFRPGRLPIPYTDPVPPGAEDIEYDSPSGGSFDGYTIISAQAKFWLRDWNEDKTTGSATPVQAGSWATKLAQPSNITIAADGTITDWDGTAAAEPVFLRLPAPQSEQFTNVTTIDLTPCITAPDTILYATEVTGGDGAGRPTGLVPNSYTFEGHMYFGCDINMVTDASGAVTLTIRPPRHRAYYRYTAPTVAGALYRPHMRSRQRGDGYGASSAPRLRQNTSNQASLRTRSFD